MQSRWSDSAAREIVQRYGEKGFAADLAYRIYGARLLGGDPRLVLRGTGSASIKARIKDPKGEVVSVIQVTAAGSDLAEVEPAELPALRLQPLQAFQSQESPSEEAIAAVQRECLLDPAAAEPSAQAFLHAFLPHRYIDCALASPVLALSDQADGMALCREVFGRRVGIVPYAPSDFVLAKAAGAVFDENPRIDGLILLKHGLVTFGDDARQSYERMIALATLAERRLKKGRRRVFVPVELPRRLARPAQIAPVLRGLLCRPAGEDGPVDRRILAYRSSESIREFVNGMDLARYGNAGSVTSSHCLHTRPRPIILPAPAENRIAAFVSATRHALLDYSSDGASGQSVPAGRAVPPDSLPRVFLVRGLGLFAAGPSAAAARRVADEAEATIEVITAAESIGRFEGLQETDLDRVAPQSAIGSTPEDAIVGPLAGHVVVVAGGAGSVGRATARAFREQGAEIALLDLDEAHMTPIAISVSGLAVRCDVTREDSLHAALDEIVETFGGIDVVVSAVGADQQGRIGEIADVRLRESFEANFFAHHTIAQAAVAIMLQQDAGGMLLFAAGAGSAQAETGLGPAALPGAATLALARQYALDYEAEGIRSMGVDTVRSEAGSKAGAGLLDRASRLDAALQANLRGKAEPSQAADIAQAFVRFALAETTATAVAPLGGASAAAAS